MVETLRKAPRPDSEPVLAQLRILSRRARLVRLTIALAILSILLAAVLVIALFLTALLRVQTELLTVILFVSCLASLIASLILFLQDINLSLAALKLDLSSIDFAGEANKTTE